MDFKVFIEGFHLYMESLKEATGNFWPTFFIGIFSALFLKYLNRVNLPPPNSKGRVCLLVLGEFARSPRMQYHAHSLARNRFHVDVVAYGNPGALNPALFDYQPVKGFVHFHFVPEVGISLGGGGGVFSKILFLIKAPVKIGLQLFVLFYYLFFEIPLPTHYLTQNPPAIPTLFVLWLTRLLRGGKLIIDWHNYGYTILNMKFQKKIESDTQPSNLIVRIAKWYEGVLGGKSQGNLCVTKAMQRDLKSTWGIDAVTLHDRPPEIFQPLSDETKGVYLRKLELMLQEECPEAYEDFCNSFNCTRSGSGKGGLFTSGTEKNPKLQPQRPCLLVSSTSWTEDEDFSVLLDALVQYEAACDQSQSPYPMAVCIITGKGPLKAHYERKIESLKLKNVFIRTLWLPSEMYPKLLGCADLGISLHLSSSGLDLPMKVVDMFGCTLPVCAMSFSCLPELVVHGSNGMVFSTSDDLFKQFRILLSGFPKQDQLLMNFRKTLTKEQAVRWDQNWEEIALPLFEMNLPGYEEDNKDNSTNRSSRLSPSARTRSPTRSRTVSPTKRTSLSSSKAASSKGKNWKGMSEGMKREAVEVEDSEGTSASVRLNEGRNSGIYADTAGGEGTPSTYLKLRAACRAKKSAVKANVAVGPAQQVKEDQGNGDDGEVAITGVREGRNKGKKGCMLREKKIVDSDDSVEKSVVVKQENIETVGAEKDGGENVEPLIKRNIVHTEPKVEEILTFDQLLSKLQERKKDLARKKEAFYEETKRNEEAHRSKAKAKSMLLLKRNEWRTRRGQLYATLKGNRQALSLDTTTRHLMSAASGVEKKIHEAALGELKKEMEEIQAMFKALEKRLEDDTKKCSLLRQKGCDSKRCYDKAKALVIEFRGKLKEQKAKKRNEEVCLEANRAKLRKLYSSSSEQEETIKVLRKRMSELEQLHAENQEEYEDRYEVFEDSIRILTLEAAELEKDLKFEIEANAKLDPSSKKRKGPTYDVPNYEHKSCDVNLNKNAGIEETHYRHHCRESVNFRKLPSAPGDRLISDFKHRNSQFCPKCYCYVCDKPAQECRIWSESRVQGVKVKLEAKDMATTLHCFAHPDDAKWQDKRRYAARNTKEGYS
eukprot:Nk52_evm26s292 gene=Nk52_evmTU26s292